MKKGLYIGLIVLLVIAFLGSAFYLGSYFLEGRKQANRYNELSNLVDEARTEAEATSPTEETKPEETKSTEPTEPKILPGLDELYEQNSDLAGWIRIEGTVVDYPVMQTSEDNANFYLYRNFDKKDSTRGSIYAREECDLEKPSDNITLYGHNMKDGSMFACLSEYYDKDYWKDNSLIFFDNLHEYHMYKIFAVFKTTANLGEGFKYHNMIDAEDEKDFNKFIKTCKDLAFYDTGITPVYGDKIICLSTCEYTLDNGRFVVAAVRIS